MPIYEYQCQACGHDVEKLQRINDEPLKDCPDCGKPKLVRLVSAAGFRLKGAGWYETDFKKGKKKNLHDGEGAGSAKPAAKPEASTTSEKKPAAAKPSAD
ncbi:MAG: zinc ribbon domain-containing protein [Xanthomonadales bacterium]|nr:zinc ribbon domain-containing protein [Gammaproteobacteria bacterium]MBT8053674.1 zinc ribbon domain-containing protein [Gammaproteobacteria bacterium]NND57071.1 zinc ribbon domain-containing protein [Xanthomonadales bacterium]NNK51847.1 zinc ribbon domain-containing protein [Xanthomonadales bacterium]